MKFWAVVGGPNTRKSSSIAGFAAITRRNPSWEIQLRVGGSIRAYVEIRSLQERNPRTTPAQFVAEVKTAVKRLAHQNKPTHVLVPLRYSGRIANPATTYIDHFVNVAGWTCLGIAVTGGKPIAPFHAYDPNALALPLPNPPHFEPSNMIANRLKAAWDVV